MLAAEFGIAHTFSVAFEVCRFDSDRFRKGGRGGLDASKEPDQLFDFATIEFGLMAQNPSLLMRSIARMEEACHVPKVLTRMEQIDDLNGAREVLVGSVPYPFSSVSDDDLLLGAIPAAIPCFQVDAASKLARGFDGAGVCRGARVANGITLVIPSGLSEDAAELHFAGMG